MLYQVKRVPSLLCSVIRGFQKRFIRSNRWKKTFQQFSMRWLKRHEFAKIWVAEWLCKSWHLSSWLKQLSNMEFSSNSMSDNSFNKDNPLKQVLQLCSTLAGKGCDFSISVRIRDCFSFSLKSGKPQPQQAVFFSLASDRMRDSFSLPVEAGASHFSVRTKNSL